MWPDLHRLKTNIISADFPFFFLSCFSFFSFIVSESELKSTDFKMETPPRTPSVEECLFFSFLSSSFFFFCFLFLFFSLLFAVLSVLLAVLSVVPGQLLVCVGSYSSLFFLSVLSFLSIL